MLLLRNFQSNIFDIPVVYHPPAFLAVASYDLAAFLAVALYDLAAFLARRFEAFAAQSTFTAQNQPVHHHHLKLLVHVGAEAETTSC